MIVPAWTVSAGDLISECSHHRSATAPATFHTMVNDIESFKCDITHSYYTYSNSIGISLRDRAIKLCYICIRQRDDSDIPEATVLCIIA